MLKLYMRHDVEAVLVNGDQINLFGFHLNALAAFVVDGFLIWEDDCGGHWVSLIVRDRCPHEDGPFYPVSLRLSIAVGPGGVLEFGNAGPNVPVFPVQYDAWGTSRLW